MIELLTGLGGWSGPMFWAPVAAWTVIAATAMLALGAARGLHPLFAYRLRQAVLLSLPITLGVMPWVAAFVPPPEVFAVIPMVPAGDFHQPSAQNQMYLRRLETFETLKLEAETERRLREL